MTEERKKIQAFIMQLPLVSWYSEKQRSSYSIKRVGKRLRLTDALMK